MGSVTGAATDAVLPSRVRATGLRFPEGPVALADGSVLCVEIAGGTLKRVWPDGRVTVVAELGGGPNGAAIGPDGRVYVCNNGGVKWRESGGRFKPLGNEKVPGHIDVVDLASGAHAVLYDRCGEREFGHPNDIVFSADGSFWFTDSGKNLGRTMFRGAIYWARADGSEVREVAAGLLSPNGIGLSPDGRELYVAETTTARLWAWKVAAPGELVKAAGPMPHGGRFVYGSAVWQRFDSLAVAASGKVVVATLDNGGFTEIAPDGSGARHVRLHTDHVNNLCFGGADLQTAYITLSGDGELIEARWHEPGLRLNFQELSR